MKERSEPFFKAESSELETRRESDNGKKEHGSDKLRAERAVDDARKKIDALRSQLQESPPREAAIAESSEEQEEKDPRDAGAFTMLRELWKAVPSEARAQLIGEFLFNPNALRARYVEEKNFRARLKSQWRKY